MVQRKHAWLLAFVTISAVVLAYRELTARGSFVGGLMIGLLLCSLLVAWLELFKARRQ